jgi:hypothetical protein
MRKTLVTLSIIASAFLLTNSANAVSFTQNNATDYSARDISSTAPYIAALIELMADEYKLKGTCPLANTYEMDVSTISSLSRLTNSGSCTVEVTFAKSPNVSGLLSNKQLAVYPSVTNQNTLDWNSLSAAANITMGPLYANKIKPGQSIPVCAKSELTKCFYSTTPFSYAIAQTAPGA